MLLPSIVNLTNPAISAKPKTVADHSIQEFFMLFTLPMFIYVTLFISICTMLIRAKCRPDSKKPFYLQNNALELIIDDF